MTSTTARRVAGLGAAVIVAAGATALTPTAAQAAIPGTYCNVGADDRYITGSCDGRAITLRWECKVSGTGSRTVQLNGGLSFRVDTGCWLTGIKSWGYTWYRS